MAIGKESTATHLKCLLAVIYLGVKNQMAASTPRVKNSCSKPATQDTDKPRHRPTREGASRRPYVEAHTQVVPPALPLPAFQGSLFLAFDPTASGKRPAIVCCSYRVSEKHREPDESAHAVCTAHNSLL